MGFDDASLDRQTRRQILKGTGAAGLAGLAGCLGGGGDGSSGDGSSGDGSSGDGSGGTPTPEPTETPTPSLKERFGDEKLNVLTWAGYEPLKKMVAQQTGATITYKLISSDVQGFNTLKGGGTSTYDIVNLDNDWAIRNAQAGNTVPVEKSNYPSTDNWVERFSWPYDTFTHQGKMYAVPIRWGWGGLGYNEDEVSLDKLKEMGYSAVWSDEFEGQVTIADWPTWVIPLILMEMGEKPFAENSQSVLDELENKLVKMFKNVTAVHGGAAAIRQDLINENAVLSLGVGNYTLSQVVFEGYDNIKIMLPDAGGWFWIGGQALVDNPDLNRDLATYFINTALSPKGQYAINAKSKSKGCPVNKAAYSEFSEEEQRKILMYKGKTFDAMEEVLENCAVYKISPQQDAWLEIWSRAKSKVGA